MREPDVIIIYVPADERAHIVSASKSSRPGASWLYSKWVYIPQADLNAFLAERLEQGYLVIDERLKADARNPGMGKATPVLCVHPQTSLPDALDAFTRLHQAILDAKDE